MFFICYLRSARKIVESVVEVLLCFIMATNIGEVFAKCFFHGNILLPMIHVIGVRMDLRTFRPAISMKENELSAIGELQDFPEADICLDQEAIFIQLILVVVFFTVAGELVCLHLEGKVF